ncbi:MAG: hypothetical protein GX633_08105 [Clostridiales bacterium]|nr:hypothetical protein [Clostridiales bacterium]
MNRKYLLPLIVGIIGAALMVAGIVSLLVSNSKKESIPGKTLGESEIAASSVPEKKFEEKPEAKPEKKPEPEQKKADPEKEKREAEIKAVTELISSGEYAAAIARIDSYETDDEATSSLLESLRADAMKKLYDYSTENYGYYISSYDYAAAAELLEPVTYFFPEDEEIAKIYEMCVSFQNTELYEGTIEHIFFHPLIAYPELAFDGDGNEAGIDSYMATVPEFKAVLEQLYDKGYILIDPHLMYTVNDNGTVSKREVYVPVGKKPIILSADNYNFMKYMRENGMVHGLALDEDGNVVTFTDDGKGNRIYSDDNEVVSITDRFVREHPDFSYGGFKGVIGLNGYEGTLGYATNVPGSKTYEQDKETVKAIADRLKKTGWAFACQSYGHNHYKEKSLKFMKNDVDKWITQVASLVGETDMYIFPYGEVIPQSDAKLAYMKERGYRFFFGSSQIPFLYYYKDNVLMTRRSIDGISLRGWRLKEVLDTASIIDSSRPAKYNN